ncbi:MAG: hypothetical protein EXS33_03555 [Pedosphaera sp.]|nr:hypothetical protein [Pedosphaera sp.]
MPTPKRISPAPSGAPPLHARVIQPVNFLHLVPGKNKPEFCRYFAHWLAGGCFDPLVRACFDAEPDAYQLKQRSKLLPAPYRKLLQSLRDEHDPKRRKEIFRQLHRILPRTKSATITKELLHRDEVFRNGYVARLIEALSSLPPKQQILHLNQHLIKNRALLPPSESRWIRATVPKDRRAAYSVKSPRTISLGNIEDDYYRHHPKLTPHKELYDQQVFSCELGGGLAAKMARPAYQGEGFRLTELAAELYTSPSRARLMAQCKTNNDSLRAVARALLWAHLNYLLHVSQSSLPQRRNKRDLIDAARKIIKQAAAGNQDRADIYRSIHRDLRSGEVAEALWNFFFDGLSHNDVLTRPGLLAKLLPPLKKDTTFLMRFLFQKRKNRPLGLVPQWIENDAAGSGLRRRLALAGLWPYMVSQKRLGKKEPEFAESLNKQAGVPSSETTTAKYLDRFARERERLGLIYPN